MPYWLIRPIIWVSIEIFYLIFGGIRFEGRRNVPRRGACLVTPNHISDADPPTICFALPRASWIMAKEELFDIRIIGRLIRWLHGFPIKRFSADRVALKKAEELLAAGECVIIFPEGQISENAELQPILPGALLIAQRTGVPIIPTIILGTDRIMPYAQIKPRRSDRRTIVRFGRPTSYAELSAGASRVGALRQAADRLHAIMLALQKGEPEPQWPPAPLLGTPPAEPRIKE